MLILENLQSPINLGMILRTAEVYQVRVGVLDPHGVLSGDRLATVADFACGALGRNPPYVARGEDDLVDWAPGRIIATSLEFGESPQTFGWRADDCIVLGNEYDGISEAMTRRTNGAIRIPLPSAFLPKPKSISPIDPDRTAPVRNDGTPSLNVAAAAAVILAYRYTNLNRTMPDFR